MVFLGFVSLKSLRGYVYSGIEWDIPQSTNLLIKLEIYRFGRCLGIIERNETKMYKRYRYRRGLQCP